MIRGSIAFAAIFALSAALAAATNGCTSDDCICLPVPPRPLAQPPFRGLRVQGPEADRSAPLSVKPENGTLEVTGDTVVIQYEQDGIQHRVLYTVTGPHRI